jgi:ABC-type transport system involved in multi-copper enzyme maturation permease subunit
MLCNASDLVLLAAWYTWLVPLWLVAAGGLAAMGAMMLVYLLLKLVFPKVAAIARTAAKEGWNQPLFWVELALGSLLLVLFVFIPYNTFGEDIKVIKDSGLTLIMLLSIGLAVWLASVSISAEIEGRTALTLLSKPVKRPQFVLGKFLGVLAPAFTMFVLLSMVFLATISYKVPYEASELSHSPPTAEQCQEEMVQIVPALVLAFLETAVLASISIAISTKLPMLPNLIICFSIYVLGHLTPLLVESSIGKLPLVTFMGRLIATLLPVLEFFRAEGAVATGQAVPWEYVGSAGIYAGLYVLIALLLALLLFDNRDLA